MVSHSGFLTIHNHLQEGTMTANNTNENIEVVNNRAQNRYEVKVGNEVAVIIYEPGEKSITFLHTEVPPALEGQGLASKLAKFALEDARAQHLSVTPLCPFVASYIRRHPDYMSLLPESEQKRIAKG
jgi:predicted GNAT family acetyltransferase